MRERPTVLIAGLDLVELTQLERALTEAGYGVSAANDAAELLRFAAERRPSLIFISDNFGGGDGGLSLCRHLKGDPATRTSSVVLICGRDTAMQPSRGADGRPDEVLVRPIHIPEVLLRSASMLRLQRYASEAMEGSRIDDLTGTFNHSHLIERLRHEVLRAGRYGRSLAVIVLDLDRFGEINHREGAAFGDLTLREVARALTSRLRGVDLVARSGPDDFSVVLPETSLLVARPISERLRVAVEGLGTALRPDGGGKLKLTASLGVAGLPHREAKDAADLLRCARAALSQAQKAGGNQTVVY
jgi:two-component system, cell cycle response regulator